MRFTKMFLSLTIIFLLFYAATNRPTTIFIAGDSTASDYESKRAPRTGWGQVFKNYFDTTIAVNNCAVSGRSSKSFITEGFLGQIEMQLKKGDYLFIQFAHNDEKKEDSTRYTEPNTTFKSYLKQYIELARKKEATPILLTPIQRGTFANPTTLKDTHGEYPKAIMEIAKEMNVPVIDMAAKTKKLFESLGPEKTASLFMNLKAGESPNYPTGNSDNTHLQESGANEICKLVIEGIKELKLPLAKNTKVQ